MVYHKECCYHGEYSKKDLLKKGVSSDLDLRKDIKNFTYEAKGMSKELSKEKIADLSKMYDKFIDPNLRPKWLPVGREITKSNIKISSPSTELARQHRKALKKRKKRKKDLNFIVSGLLS
jgi:hypothetical protein